MRPKHPRKELEQLICDLEQAKWVVTKNRKYYRAACKCKKKCLAWIKMTPSNPNYEKLTRRNLERETCWDGKG